MDKLEHFFNENNDKEIFVVYKNSKVGDLRPVHSKCVERDKVLTILMPKVNKYPADVANILETDNRSRIYEVSVMAMKSVLKKRGEQYVQQVRNSVLVPSEFFV